ncbi:MAG TPA: DUF6178 family protein [Kofleriaceae bacterium]|nr:DUF6178 family protein [Kofleriaceae bacterium]
MSERDVPPPSGPLARLRAHLAGPRGYRRIDALLSADDAPAAIAALSASEIYELVHEVGFEDGQALIEYATPSQIQGCFDLDGWNKDQLEVVSLKPWLAALIEVGFEKVGEVWGALDAELRTLILQKQVLVYDTTMNEGPEEDNDEPIMTTPDRFFLLELKGDDDTQRLTQQLVEDLYRADPQLARHTIMAARSEPPAELEEMAYRWRSGRLADFGYVDFYEALDLFRPLPADQVHIGEGSQDRPIEDASSHLPVVIVEEVIGRSFLARAMAAIDDDREAERLEGSLMVLVNKVLAAGRAKPGQSEVMRRGALYATATLSLGLDVVARGDLERAKQALQSISLGRLFRVGYTVTHKLAKLATALAPRSPTAGSPAKDLVAGLCSPRPLFSRAADEPAMPGLRPFESQADLRRAGEILTGLTIRIALVEGLGVDVLAMGQAPEPRPELDDHIRTALARSLVGGEELRGDALSQAELTQLRKTAFDASGKLTDIARRAGHAAINARLGAAQLAASGPLLGRLIDSWLDDLERILGGIKEGDVDPRFVEGVIVEVQRS